MQSDAFYTIGRGHSVCQDYARAGTMGAGDAPHGAFGLVSDGCSSSADSDVGARLLVLEATRVLSAGQPLVMRPLIERALSSARRVGMAVECLDATLLSVSCTTAGALWVQVVGDGTVVARRRDGRLEVWRIGQGSAPAYASYMLDAERWRAYRAGADAVRRVEHCLDGEVAGRQCVPLQHWQDLAWRLRLSRERYETVAVFSDGVDSFRGRDGRVAQLQDIERALVAFRSTRGAFLQRRMGRFVRRECPERGWAHEDDLSGAAIHLGG